MLQFCHVLSASVKMGLESQVRRHFQLINSVICLEESGTGKILTFSMSV